MNDKQRKMIFELFTGTIISQEIIIQALHKNGLIKKRDIVDRLDYFIDYFERKGSEQIAVPMRYLRKNLGKGFPETGSAPRIPPGNGYPKWFQGVIHGGLESSSRHPDRE
ncbi:MAG: hypothetical protein IH614_07465 [Desulfuromonadales bacterium]|nr:hypothetical protein [Desulfuromonadales bacterium]